jgi:hypothetical protein
MNKKEAEKAFDEAVAAAMKVRDEAHAAAWEAYDEAEATQGHPRSLS